MVKVKGPQHYPATWNSMDLPRTFSYSAAAQLVLTDFAN